MHQQVQQPVSLPPSHSRVSQLLGLFCFLTTKAFVCRLLFLCPFKYRVSPLLEPRCPSRRLDLFSTPPTRPHTHTPAHAHAYMHAHMCMHTHVRAHAPNMHVHAHTDTHGRTRTHMHTDTRTHTRTHNASVLALYPSGLPRPSRWAPRLSFAPEPRHPPLLLVDSTPVAAPSHFQTPRGETRVAQGWAPTPTSVPGGSGGSSEPRLGERTSERGTDLGVSPAGCGAAPPPLAAARTSRPPCAAAGASSPWTWARTPWDLAGQGCWARS